MIMKEERANIYSKRVPFSIPMWYAGFAFQNKGNNSTKSMPRSVQ